ncbi:hypothetical protein BDN72DRAFT_841550 [Pluteus cervinus]|uniref:Uncharacterized protein n=1 Tax=Pluteus cervinus TaxID=181527 RepID=A0ACD3ATC4_9AGAR|nr:hypothetical protein BDN72DRAFT_841550 [Pluteus cervinus]
MTSYEERLDVLNGRIREFIDNFASAKRDDQHEKAALKRILRVMKDLCALGREAEQDPDANGRLDDILGRIEGLIYQAIRFCRKKGLYERTTSFAHATTIKYKYPGDDTYEGRDFDKNSDSEDSDESDHDREYPLVRDTNPKGVVSHQMRNMLSSFVEFMTRGVDPGSLFSSPAPLPNPPAPWWDVMRPHPRSSGLSRFRENVPTLSATGATPTALNVYQARCEVRAAHIHTPVRMFSQFSGTDCILSIPSMGGYKERTPMLNYLVNAEPTESANAHSISHTFSVGLADIAYHSAIDPSRKLIFVGDSDRVKSFEWGKPETEGDYYSKAKAIHTFASKRFGGPMIVVGGGRFLRGGKGRIGVWNLDDLTEETHSKYGDQPLGGADISTDDTWRDDADDIETSKGTAVGQTINLWLPTVKPRIMAHHPSGAANLILFGAANSDPESSSGSNPQSKYPTVFLDIEHGKPVSKILGHGDEVVEFSTSKADPNIFVTGCKDGYARLFDVRTHFPVITFDAANREDVCGAVALAHPDGVPSLFTGLQTGECIQLWDIRAKAVVYDLGVGNNSVESLAWDEYRQILYAAARCQYMTRTGNYTDYRRRVTPRPPKQIFDNEEPVDDDNNQDENEDQGWLDGDYDYDGRSWPTKARHGEDYYPHVFDAASHKLLRYTFKTDPNPDILPN